MQSKTSKRHTLTNYSHSRQFQPSSSSRLSHGQSPQSYQINRGGDQHPYTHVSKMHADVAQHILENCDRTRSAEARKALNKIVWTPLRRHNIELTASQCILAEENDILLAQEEHKRQVKATAAIWQCTKCNKMFRSEWFLDKHMMRRHAHLRHNECTVCLADYCGSMIPCVPLTERPLPTLTSHSLLVSTPPSERAGTAAAGNFCQNAEIRKRRLQACSKVVQDCMGTAKHSESGTGVLQAHAQRLRMELCERAMMVECIPRAQVWQKLGGNVDVILATQAAFPLLYVSACFALAVVMVFALVYVSGVPPDDHAHVAVVRSSRSARAHRRSKTRCRKRPRHGF